jgi:hypothetical protein
MKAPLSNYNTGRGMPKIKCGIGLPEMNNQKNDMEFYSYLLD